MTFSSELLASRRGAFVSTGKEKLMKMKRLGFNCCPYTDDANHSTSFHQSASINHSFWSTKVLLYLCCCRPSQWNVILINSCSQSVSHSLWLVHWPAAEGEMAIINKKEEMLINISFILDMNLRHFLWYSLGKYWFQTNNSNQKHRLWSVISFSPGPEKKNHNMQMKCLIGFGHKTQVQIQIEFFFYASNCGASMHTSSRNKTFLDIRYEGEKPKKKGRGKVNPQE